jgi:hypothetical protein
MTSKSTSRETGAPTRRTLRSCNAPQRSVFPFFPGKCLNNQSPVPWIINRQQFERAQLTHQALPFFPFDRDLLAPASHALITIECAKPASSPVLSGRKYRSENALRNFRSYTSSNAEQKCKTIEGQRISRSRPCNHAVGHVVTKSEQVEKKQMTSASGTSGRNKHKRSLPAPRLSTVQTLFQNRYPK